MDPIFTEDFIKKLPRDNTLAIKTICDRYHSYIKDYICGKMGFALSYFLREHPSILLDAFAFIEAFYEIRNINFDHGVDITSEDDVGKQINETILAIKGDIEEVLQHDNYRKAKEKYLMVLESGFYYEFSKGDVDAIKQLIKDLREKIESCEELEEDHRSRVLIKLNDLDTELNIKMTKLDKVYILITEAQILVHKLGETSKPIIQIIKQIVNFAWRAEARAEGLSSDTCLTLPEESQIEELDHDDKTDDN